MLSPIYPQLEEQIIFALEMALNIGFFCMCVCLHYEYFRSYSYVCHGSYHLERVVIVSLNAHCWKNIVGFSYICEHVNDEVKKPFKDQYSMNKREREREIDYRIICQLVVRKYSESLARVFAGSHQKRAKSGASCVRQGEATGTNA